ncbi:hypothetical protein HAX54_005991 [Datura stramonium]|uniref:Uncharacterized protein n=1 Tax=Datura stramonium TaxID=4076 RepID=A0ABS8RIC0_DATST|nr:hypothetical protein [Datura stramonium]
MKGWLRARGEAEEELRRGFPMRAAQWCRCRRFNQLVAKPEGFHVNIATQEVRDDKFSQGTQNKEKMGFQKFLKSISKPTASD